MDSSQEDATEVATSKSFRVKQEARPRRNTQGLKAIESGRVAALKSRYESAAITIEQKPKPSRNTHKSQSAPNFFSRTSNGESDNRNDNNTSKIDQIILRNASNNKEIQEQENKTTHSITNSTNEVQTSTSCENTLEPTPEQKASVHNEQNVDSQPSPSTQDNTTTPESSVIQTQTTSENCDSLSETASNTEDSMVEGSSFSFTDNSSNFSELSQASATEQAFIVHQPAETNTMETSDTSSYFSEPSQPSITENISNANEAVEASTVENTASVKETAETSASDNSSNFSEASPASETSPNANEATSTSTTDSSSNFSDTSQPSTENSSDVAEISASSTISNTNETAQTPQNNQSVSEPSTETDTNTNASPSAEVTNQHPRALNPAKKSKSRANVTRPGTYKLVAEDFDNPLWEYHNTFKKGANGGLEGTSPPATGVSPPVESAFPSDGSSPIATSGLPPQGHPSAPPARYRTATVAVPSATRPSEPVSSSPPTSSSPTNEPSLAQKGNPLEPSDKLSPPLWTAAPRGSVLMAMPKQVTAQRKNSRAAMIDLKGPAKKTTLAPPVEISQNNNNNKPKPEKPNSVKKGGSVFKGENDFKAYTSFLIANKEKTIAARQSQIATWHDELDEIDKSIQQIVVSEPEPQLPDVAKIEQMFPWFQDLLQDEQVQASVARRLSHMEEDENEDRVKLYVDSLPRAAPAAEVRRSEVKARSYTVANVSSVPIPQVVASSPPTNSPPTSVSPPVSYSPPTGTSPPTTAAEKNPSMGRKRMRKQTSFRTKMKHYNACYRAGWLHYYERGLRPKWVRRWAVFSFEENKVSLFEDPKDKNPKNGVLLDDAVNVSKCNFQGKANGFCIRAKRAHYFAADTEPEAKEWMNLVEFSLVFLDSKALKQWMQLSQTEKETFYQKAHTSISEPFNVQKDVNNPLANQVKQQMNLAQQQMNLAQQQQ